MSKFKVGDVVHWVKDSRTSEGNRVVAGIDGEHVWFTNGFNMDERYVVAGPFLPRPKPVMRVIK